MRLTEPELEKEWGYWLPEIDVCQKAQRLADAATEKAYEQGQKDKLAELSAQCGDGCNSCSLHGSSCRPEETHDYCEFIRIWMSGYAKGQQLLQEAKDIVSLILPLAKGYAAAHPVGSNQEYVNTASEWLQERGK